MLLNTVTSFSSIDLTLYGHIKIAEQRTVIQQYVDWYLVQRGGAPPSSLRAVPNVTAHPSTIFC